MVFLACKCGSTFDGLGFEGVVLCYSCCRVTQLMVAVTTVSVNCYNCLNHGNKCICHHHPHQRYHHHQVANGVSSPKPLSLKQHVHHQLANLHACLQPSKLFSDNQQTKWQTVRHRGHQNNFSYFCSRISYKQQLYYYLRYSSVCFSITPQ